MSICHVRSQSWRYTFIFPIPPFTNADFSGQGRDVDLLLGLDMLKAHQACIDLEKGVLRIQGREVKFLSEHELPDKARMMDAGVDDSDPQAGPSASGSLPHTGGGSAPHFPGSGNTLGAPLASSQTAPLPTAASAHPESAIATIMGLGTTREMAITTLDAAGGNLDVAASLLF
ncbi:hypothetical protein OF83DRAFT_410648 [Amylostereum chailletii]|nr:hypothetical protein OF83DRAFT_410648 [Amylostereum chailletii]